MSNIVDLNDLSNEVENIKKQLIQDKVATVNLKQTPGTITKKQIKDILLLKCNNHLKPDTIKYVNDKLII